MAVYLANAWKKGQQLPAKASLQIQSQSHLHKKTQLKALCQFKHHQFPHILPLNGSELLLPSSVLFQFMLEGTLLWKLPMTSSSTYPLDQ